MAVSTAHIPFPGHKVYTSARQHDHMARTGQANRAGYAPLEAAVAHRAKLVTSSLLHSGCQTMLREGNSCQILTSFLGPFTASRNFVKSLCSTKYAAPLVNEKSVVSMGFIFCEDWKLPSTAWKNVSRNLLLYEPLNACQCQGALTRLKQGDFASSDACSCQAEDKPGKVLRGSRVPRFSWALLQPIAWLEET